MDIFLFDMDVIKVEREKYKKDMEEFSVLQIQQMDDMKVEYCFIFEKIVEYVVINEQFNILFRVVQEVLENVEVEVVEMSQQFVQEKMECMIVLVDLDVVKSVKFDIFVVDVFKKEFEVVKQVYVEVFVVQEVEFKVELIKVQNVLIEMKDDFELSCKDFEVYCVEVDVKSQIVVVDYKDFNDSMIIFVEEVEKKVKVVEEKLEEFFMKIQEGEKKVEEFEVQFKVKDVEIVEVKVCCVLENIWGKVIVNNIMQVNVILLKFKGLVGSRFVNVDDDENVKSDVVEGEEEEDYFLVVLVLV